MKTHDKRNCHPPDNQIDFRIGAIYDNGMRRNGSILLIVMWSLFFLSLLAVALFAGLKGSAEAARRIQQRTHAYYLARAGVATATAVVRTVGSNAWHGFNDEWSRSPNTFSDVKAGEQGTFSVWHTADDGNGRTSVWYGLADENSRINLNGLPLNLTGYAVLKSLFVNVGKIDNIAAGSIAAAIIDWRDSTNGIFVPEQGVVGAENEYYQGHQLPYSCRNGPLKTIEELLLVRGISSDIFDLIRDSVTVYPIAEMVNINTAQKPVLRALTGAIPNVDQNAAEDLVDAIIKARNDQLVFTNRSDIATVMEHRLDPRAWTVLQQIRYLLGVQSTHFRGWATGTPGKDAIESRTIEFVVANDGRIVYWLED